jgi:hypothetical protein
VEANEERRLGITSIVWAQASAFSYLCHEAQKRFADWLVERNNNIELLKPDVRFTIAQLLGPQNLHDHPNGR